MEYELAMNPASEGVCRLTNYSRMACFLVLGMVLYRFILLGSEIKSMFTSCVFLQQPLLPVRDCSLLFFSSSNSLDYLALE